MRVHWAYMHIFYLDYTPIRYDHVKIQLQLLSPLNLDYKLWKLCWILQWTLKQLKILCSVDGFRTVNHTMYVLLQSFIIVIFIIMITRQKGGDLTQSYDKSPYTHGNVKRAVTTQTTSQKSSIKQRLRTDLGRSVGVTTATQLVWLTWFTGPTFPLPATAV